MPVTSEERAVEIAELHRFCDEAAERVGVPDGQRALFVDGLVEADLRGISSHGVERLPAYCRAFAAGVVNPAPALAPVREGGAVALLDGDNGLGVVVGQLAMQRAIELARDFGIGCISVRNSNHAGMLASHVLHATRAGMIGFFTSNSPAIMAPWGGREPGLGNGPLAFAIPSDDEPIVLDMASSAVARGKVRLYAARNEPIPPGWALDADGRETTDASAALAGVVLPAAGYKGYGLAFVNELLAAGLSGAAFAAEMPRDFLAEGSRVLDRWQCGHLAIALDPAAAVGLAELARAAARLTESMHSAPRAAGDQPILVPGEPERLSRAAQLVAGITLAASTLAKLDELSAELEIAELTRRNGAR